MAIQPKASTASVRFVSGTRFVENGRIATAGGLTSGIDLALHIVARYYGSDVAQVTATFWSITVSYGKTRNTIR
jgi:transcriptional regulator GlxA family with amidase domain